MIATALAPRHRADRAPNRRAVEAREVRAVKDTVSYSVDDEQVLGQVAHGDEAALSVLYERYSGAVFTLLVRIVTDRQIAEELVQEAFLRVWQHASTYNAARGRVHSWLLGIAQHLAYDELRRRGRRPQRVQDSEAAERELGQLSQAGPDLPELSWLSTRQTELVRAIADLPPPQRVAVALYARGYSQSEIASGLGEPLGTVKTRLRRGFEAMRTLLERAGIDE